MEVGTKSMKQDYMKQTARITLYIGSGVALILGLFYRNLGIGLFLGLLVGEANLWVTSNYVDNLFFKGEFTIISFILYALLNYSLMILAFLLSVLYPNWVNIYMVAVGLFMLKLVMYARELLFYKKGGSK
jgi:hypothetical protein